MHPNHIWKHGVGRPKACLRFDLISQMFACISRPSTWQSQGWSSFLWCQPAAVSSILFFHSLTLLLIPQPVENEWWASWENREGGRRQGNKTKQIGKVGGGRVNSWILTCTLPCPLLSPCLGNGPVGLRPSAQRPGHWHLRREQLIIYWAAVGVAQLRTAAFIFPRGFYISHIPRPCVRSFSFRQDNALISNWFSQEDPWMVNRIPPLESSSPVCLNLFFSSSPL